MFVPQLALSAYLSSCVLGVEVECFGLVWVFRLATVVNWHD